MSRHLAIARTSRALALADLTTAAWLLVNDELLLAILTVWAAPSLIAVDALCRRAHHRARAEAQRTARLEAGETVPPLVPCCSFWRNSVGQVHGPDCTRPAAARTRPPLPRRDRYRLDDTSRTTFNEIAAHYDESAA